jgi:hypothetical protein
VSRSAVELDLGRIERFLAPARESATGRILLVVQHASRLCMEIGQVARPAHGGTDSPMCPLGTPAFANTGRPSGMLEPALGRPTAGMAHAGRTAPAGRRDPVRTG